MGVSTFSRELRGEMLYGCKRCTARQLLKRKILEGSVGWDHLNVAHGRHLLYFFSCPKVHVDALHPKSKGAVDGEAVHTDEAPLLHAGPDVSVLSQLGVAIRAAAGDSWIASRRTGTTWSRYHLMHYESPVAPSRVVQTLP